MTESTIELEMPVLLPGVDREDDACLDRLETALQNQKSLKRVHLERGKRPLMLCLHYDPDTLSLAEVERLAARAGARIANRYRHALIPIEGMDCSDCVTAIEHSVRRIEGVLVASVSYAAQKMRVEFDARKIDRGAIENRLRAIGYGIPATGLRSWYEAQRELVFSLTSGALLLMGWLAERFFALPAPGVIALYLAALLLGGWDVARHAWHALRERQVATDLLMVMAALGAAALGELAEGALLLFLQPRPRP